MSSDAGWQPTHTDPLFIMAMDHRGSFGKTLFEVHDDAPTAEQRAHMERAKRLIYDGLRNAAPRLTAGRPGCLVDEQYGQSVIDAVSATGTSGPVVLAVPIEASGHDWFTLQWGDAWRAHVEKIRPAYAKVLVRDNPDFDAAKRATQLADLAAASSGLQELGVPLLYELLVPATDAQLAAAGGDTTAYDTDIRPGLVAHVLADNQDAGVEPRLWKVEGLETVDAAELVARQARHAGRDADLIVLGRDAPTERLDHWVDIASQVSAFVGFAIGRSIWEDAIEAFEKSAGSDADVTQARDTISARYLEFASHWHAGQ